MIREKNYEEFGDKELERQWHREVPATTRFLEASSACALTVEFQLQRLQPKHWQISDIANHTKSTHYSIFCSYFLFIKQSLDKNAFYSRKKN